MSMKKDENDIIEDFTSIITSLVLKSMDTEEEKTEKIIEELNDE